MGDAWGGGGGGEGEDYTAHHLNHPTSGAGRSPKLRPLPYNNLDSALIITEYSDIAKERNHRSKSVASCYVLATCITTIGGTESRQVIDEVSKTFIVMSTQQAGVSHIQREHERSLSAGHLVSYSVMTKNTKAKYGLRLLLNIRNKHMKKRYYSCGGSRDGWHGSVELLHSQRKCI